MTTSYPSPGINTPKMFVTNRFACSVSISLPRNCARIAIPLAVLVLLAATGRTLTGQRLAEIGRTALAESGPISPKLRRQMQNPVLSAAHQVRDALALGMVFLMVFKPALNGALLAMAAALLVGLVSSAPIWSRNRTPEKPARLDAERSAQ